MPQLAGTFPRFSPNGSVVLACPVLADVELTEISPRHQIFDDHLGSSLNILGKLKFFHFFSLRNFLLEITHLMAQWVDMEAGKITH